MLQNTFFQSPKSTNSSRNSKLWACIICMFLFSGQNIQTEQLNASSPKKHMSIKIQDKIYHGFYISKQGHLLTTQLPKTNLVFEQKTQAPVVLRKIYSDPKGFFTILKNISEYNHIPLFEIGSSELLNEGDKLFLEKRQGKVITIDESRFEFGECIPTTFNFSKHDLGKPIFDSTKKIIGMTTKTKNDFCVFPMHKFYEQTIRFQTRKTQTKQTAFVQNKDLSEILKQIRNTWNKTNSKQNHLQKSKHKYLPSPISTIQGSSPYPFSKILAMNFDQDNALYALDSRKHVTRIQDSILNDSSTKPQPYWKKIPKAIHLSVNTEGLIHVLTKKSNIVVLNHKLHIINDMKMNSFQDISVPQSILMLQNKLHVLFHPGILYEIQENLFNSLIDVKPVYVNPKKNMIIQSLTTDDVAIHFLEKHTQKIYHLLPEQNIFRLTTQLPKNSKVQQIHIANNAIYAWDQRSDSMLKYDIEIKMWSRVSFESNISRRIQHFTINKNATRIAFALQFPDEIYIFSKNNNQFKQIYPKIQNNFSEGILPLPKNIAIHPQNQTIAIVNGSHSIQMLKPNIEKTNASNMNQNTNQFTMSSIPFHGAHLDEIVFIDSKRMATLDRKTYNLLFLSADATSILHTIALKDRFPNLEIAQIRPLYENIGILDRAGSRLLLLNKEGQTERSTTLLDFDGTLLHPSCFTNSRNSMFFANRNRIMQYTPLTSSKPSKEIILPLQKQFPSIASMAWTAKSLWISDGSGKRLFQYIPRKDVVKTWKMNTPLASPKFQGSEILISDQDYLYILNKNNHDIKIHSIKVLSDLTKQ